jgi:cysteinyl-tRNA synthetase
MMTLRLYNTLTRQKEDFKPLDPQNVRMYVCGPTVYDFAHIGNARPVIVFDVLFRFLRHLYPGTGKASDGSRVEYVRNITDVDDKINARALRDFPDLPLNEAIRRVTEKTANQFQADVKALGCLEPTQQPRATEFIAQMIDMISKLLAKGHAYEAGGEVLFSVTSMKDYGQLSNRKLEDQQAGARVAVDAHKRNPGDFVLWKLSSAEEPGWESPWGRGRPGWHIECSAMSRQFLGEVFDIHGGGLDLIFPHHENEIAQSRCAHGTSVMANVWMHNGFLQVEGQKMSKSLGNFLTIDDVLKESSGTSIRYAMLMTHYTQPIDWTQSKLLEARMSLQKFNRWYVDQNVAYETDFDPSLPHRDVLDALNDDLNTPEAFASLHRQVGALSDRSIQATNAHNKHLAEFSNSLKLLGIAPQSRATEVDAATVESYINSRLAARAAKDWKESDRIRDELAAMGVTIKDNKDGTTSWEVKR